MQTLEATGETRTVGTKEAAALLGCSERRIRRMIRAGELRAEKTRGRYGLEYRIDVTCLPGETCSDPVEELSAPLLDEEGPLTTGAQEVELLLSRGCGEEGPTPEVQDEELFLTQPQEAEQDPLEVSVGEFLRMRVEREQWQRRWADAQETLARLAVDGERVAALEMRVGRLVEAEARARAEAEAAQRREEEMARHERESRDLVEQARRRAEELDREVREVLQRAKEITQKEEDLKAAARATLEERERLAAEVTRLRDVLRQRGIAALLAVAVALTSLVGMIVAR